MSPRTELHDQRQCCGEREVLVHGPGHVVSDLRWTQERQLVLKCPGVRRLLPAGFLLQEVKDVLDALRLAEDVFVKYATDDETETPGLPSWKARSSENISRGDRSRLPHGNALKAAGLTATQDTGGWSWSGPGVVRCILPPAGVLGSAQRPV